MLACTVLYVIGDAMWQDAFGIFSCTKLDHFVREPCDVSPCCVIADRKAV